MKNKFRDHFLIYSTANERDYRTDFYNFYLMVRHNPGVKRIRLFIVVSDVDGLGKKEEKFIETTNKIFDGSRYIKLEKILIKGNIGRDLSSAKVGLDEISNYANPDDIIMVRNRSSIGPFEKKWYSAYLNLFDDKENIGLVGNTINLQYHEEVDPERIAPHVQTYIYLSSYFLLDKLRADFPGINEVDRLKIICNGEIALSERIMEMGYKISSLFWRGEVFGKDLPINESLPKKDIKENIRGLPFIHRRGLEGSFSRRFHFTGKLGLAMYSLRKNAKQLVEVKRLDQFYT